MRRTGTATGSQNSVPAFSRQWSPALEIGDGLSIHRSHGGLRKARDLYQKWVDAAPAAEIVVALRHLASEDESERPISSPLLCRCLHTDLYHRVGRRTDGNYIQIFADSGEEPPDFVWKNHDCGGVAPPSHRARGSARARGKPSVESGNLRGFRHHLDAERGIRYRVEEAADYEKRRGNGKKPVEVAFAETPGLRQLFSVVEASALFAEGAKRSDSDSRAYLENTLRDIVKRGNRRGLAAAPSKEAIENLRRDFPNASAAIDEVERAAALAWMTPDGWFRMSPLLIWGPPGVGKTAFLQALARCLGVPFKRFDIGTTSMGGQLFGLSLSWSTGHVGDIFRMLAESPCLNPVVLLDEVDKAGGNGNAPVIPPLLALLEKETSRSFRDEAVPLAMDASQIVWFAAGNERHHMSRPLQSRFNEVRMERPDGEAAVRVAESIYRSLRADNPWGKRFPEELDRPMALILASRTPREMSRALSIAFGEAARQGRTYLKVDDFPMPLKPRTRMGFL
jgi:ATP-dependent Lon protease